LVFFDFFLKENFAKKKSAQNYRYSIATVTPTSKKVEEKYRLAISTVGCCNEGKIADLPFS
jgi:hypothetical protein